MKIRTNVLIYFSVREKQYSEFIRVKWQNVFRDVYDLYYNILYIWRLYINDDVFYACLTWFTFFSSSHNYYQVIHHSKLIVKIRSITTINNVVHVNGRFEMPCDGSAASVLSSFHLYPGSTTWIFHPTLVCE